MTADQLEIALDHRPVADEDGVEKIDEGEGVITTPYDPSKTSIVTKQQSVDSLAKRIEHGEIDMAPEFQRRADLWSAEKMSRLIESLLIRVPLPSFYFDGSDDNRWLVVDGLQRLSTFKRFLVAKDLELIGLEYLTDYNGCRFERLPRDLQRRIEETQVTLHIIQAGTPTEVKFNIFSRINTGGLSLTPQEIRHALYQGPATRLLAELAESEEFKQATDGSVSPRRMADREMVLRFLAFTLTPYAEYKHDNLDDFLNEHMRRLNQLPVARRDGLAKRFRRAMISAHSLFNERAFRKPSDPGERRFPISKPLFEVWSVALGRCSRQQLACLVSRSNELYAAFESRIADQDFYHSISVSTNNAIAVRSRFSVIEEIIEEVGEEVGEEIGDEVQGEPAA